MELLKELNTLLEAKNTVILHKLKMDNEAMVSTIDEFGSKDENPSGYNELKAVFKIFGLKDGDENKLWAYDEDAWETEYKKLAKALGIDAEDRKLADHGFVKAKSVGNTDLWLNEKAKAITTVDKGDYVPAVIYVAK